MEFTAQELYTGIVLYVPPRRGVISLLDKDHGRIDCITSIKGSYSPGEMISYQVIKKGDRFFVDYCRLLYSPLFLARLDILFLHHIIELVRTLVPCGVYEPDLFPLLRNLYTESVPTSLVKKIMISNILAIVGIFVEPIPESCKTFWKIPIDMINLGSLHLLYEQHLDGWLTRCFSQHPLLCDLKTVRLLKAENFFEGK